MHHCLSGLADAPSGSAGRKDSHQKSNYSTDDNPKKIQGNVFE
jgi:hypothetical protein